MKSFKKTYDLKPWLIHTLKKMANKDLRDTPEDESSLCNLQKKRKAISNTEKELLNWKLLLGKMEGIDEFLNIGVQTRRERKLLKVTLLLNIFHTKLWRVKISDC